MTNPPREVAEEQPDAVSPAVAGPPPVDHFAYRIAVGALGAALVAFLIGAALIAAGGKPVPTQYWSTGSAIAGALMGILAPAPQKGAVTVRDNPAMQVVSHIAAAIRDLWNNRALLILLVIFGVSLGFAVTRNSAPLETVAAAAGGALIGLLAPPPGSQTTQ